MTTPSVPRTMLGVPWRHWRSYGTAPLPTPQEALDEPLRAFPPWFLGIEWERLR